MQSGFPKWLHQYSCVGTCWFGKQEVIKQDPGDLWVLVFPTWGPYSSLQTCPAAALPNAQGGSYRQSSCCPWGTCHGTAWDPGLQCGKRLHKERLGCGQPPCQLERSSCRELPVWEVASRMQEGQPSPAADSFSWCSPKATVVSLML